MLEFWLISHIGLNEKDHLLVGDLCSRGSVINRIYIVNCGSTLANFLNLNV
jgi:hypothetical protein